MNDTCFFMTGITSSLIYSISNVTMINRLDYNMKPSYQQALSNHYLYKTTVLIPLACFIRPLSFPQNAKTERYSFEYRSLESGDDLLSRAVSSQVPSAL